MGVFQLRPRFTIDTEEHGPVDFGGPSVARHRELRARAGRATDHLEFLAFLARSMVVGMDGVDDGELRARGIDDIGLKLSQDELRTFCLNYLATCRVPDVDDPGDAPESGDAGEDRIDEPDQDAVSADLASASIDELAEQVHQRWVERSQAYAARLSKTVRSIAGAASTSTAAVRRAQEVMEQLAGLPHAAPLPAREPPIPREQIQALVGMPPEYRTADGVEIMAERTGELVHRIGELVEVNQRLGTALAAQIGIQEASQERLEQLVVVGQEDVAEARRQAEAQLESLEVAVESSASSHRSSKRSLAIALTSTMIAVIALTLGILSSAGSSRQNQTMLDEAQAQTAVLREFVAEAQAAKSAAVQVTEPLPVPVTESAADPVGGNEAVKSKAVDSKPGP